MHKTTKLHRLLSLAALLLLLTPLTVLTGCQTTYGSRKVDARIDTLPATLPAHVYLVKLEAWANLTNGLKLTQPYSPPNQAWFQQQLEPYRASTEGKSQHPINALPYETMCVVESLGRYWWTPIKPQADKVFEIHLDP